MNITVASYVDSVAFGIIACERSVPHVADIALGFGAAVADLRKLALETQETGDARELVAPAWTGLVGARPELTQHAFELTFLFRTVARVAQPNVRVGEIVPDEGRHRVRLLGSEALLEPARVELPGREFLAVGDRPSGQGLEGGDEELVEDGGRHRWGEFSKSVRCYGMWQSRANLAELKALGRSGFVRAADGESPLRGLVPHEAAMLDLLARLRLM